ncbi:hypothetical protein [Fusobacterium sp. FSA-380-WT-2B]|uniref:hypothetical protein n=1 Tax=Fusobacterium sp. FSA-380-WT-2B TaxID=2605786 RepID=UPI0012B3FC9D|nr:hypothetical protein [Fusobacterium sp. FSA-380-WT-2B]MSS61458.1 hypothetical protein [Fusobacterium sp. FSA-380-WT-2B]
MKFEFIKSLENVKHGATYYQDNTGKIEIGCYELGLKITDYENLTYYYRKVNNETSLTLFKNILEENPIKNISDLIKVLSTNEEYTQYSFEKNKVFNPFIKEIQGKLEVKLSKKSGRLTKPQVKKILTHKDTEVIIDSKYSDDYAYDYAMDYFKNVKTSRLSALYDVFSYFNCAFKEKDNTVSLIVAGHSTTMVLKNKNLRFIEG